MTTQAGTRPWRRSCGCGAAAYADAGSQPILPAPASPSARDGISPAPLFSNPPAMGTGAPARGSKRCTMASSSGTAPCCAAGNPGLMHSGLGAPGTALSRPSGPEAPASINAGVTAGSRLGLVTGAGAPGSRRKAGAGVGAAKHGCCGRGAAPDGGSTERGTIPTALPAKAAPAGCGSAPGTGSATGGALEPILGGLQAGAGSTMGAGKPLAGCLLCMGGSMRSRRLSMGNCQRRWRPCCHQGWPCRHAWRHRRPLSGYRALCAAVCWQSTSTCCSSSRRHRRAQHQTMCQHGLAAAGRRRWRRRRQRRRPGRLNAALTTRTWDCPAAAMALAAQPAAARRL